MWQTAGWCSAPRAAGAARGFADNIAAADDDGMFAREATSWSRSNSKQPSGVQEQAQPAGPRVYSGIDHMESVYLSRDRWR